MSRVLFFVPFFFGRGPERVMVNLARGMREKGLEVDFLVGRADVPFVEELGKSGRVIELGCSRTILCLPGLIRYMKQEKPYFVISALEGPNIIVLISRFFTNPRPKVIITVHSVLSKALKEKNFMYSLVILPLIRLFYPLADAIVAVSEGVSKELNRLAGIKEEKISVIYNPVITPELFEKAKEEVSHPWFNQKNFPVVVSVGRLTPAKDFSTLMRAFSIVKGEIEAKLIIIGDGEDKENLESLVKKLGLENDVEFTGFISNPYKYIKRSSLFVLSSKYEALPTVLIEAMALGIPVVATDCPGGVKEILGYGKCGEIVPVGDSEKLAEGILRVLKFGGTSINQKLCSEILNNFKLETCLEQYLALISYLKDSGRKDAA